MSALWIAASFVAGWVACWKTSSFLVRRVLRRPDSSIAVDSLAGLKHENLLKVRDAVNAEVWKRGKS